MHFSSATVGQISLIEIQGNSLLYFNNAVI